MTDEYWVCPDCAEPVAAGTTPCPYCGYGTGRPTRWGHCTACGGPRWEGALERCATCGAPLAIAPATPEVPEDPRSSGVSGGDLVGSGSGSGSDDDAGSEKDPAAAVPDAASPPETPTHTSGDALAVLRELARLRDEGVLTAAEFEAKKAEILERL